MNVHCISFSLFQAEKFVASYNTWVPAGSPLEIIKAKICMIYMDVSVGAGRTYILLNEETDRLGSIWKAGVHLGPDCGL